MTSSHTAPRRLARNGALVAGLRHVRPHLLAAGGISLVANLLMLTPTLYMLQLYERVMASQNLGTLAAVSVVAVVSLLAMAWADRRRNRRLILASVALDERLAPQVMASAQRAVVAGEPLGPGPLNDLAQLRQFLTGPATIALFDAPWAPIYVAVLWLIHPWLGLAALGFMLLQFALAWWGHQLSEGNTAPVASADQAANGFLQHKFRHAEVVESMGMARGLWQRWQQRHAQQLAASGEAQSQTNTHQALSRLLRYAQQSLALGLGGWLVVRGELGVGMMIAANVLTTRALAPVDALAGAWRGLSTAMAATHRLDRLLEQFPPLAVAADVPRLTGAIGLDIDRARLPHSERTVLEDIHLQLEPGSVTVLMGPSGAGKSTLARVLAGAWPGAEAWLSHDGQVLNASERIALGPQIAYLPQEIDLADASVQDNIARLGKPDPNAVIAAAKRCGLHEAILRLPKGYDTRIGQGGHPLSGGTRQRLALARAVYGNPPLLVLDEPNAHLDDAGEAALATLLRSHREAGGTALVISHRRGVLAVADRVLVMENGRIVTDGPRDRVLAAHQAAAQEGGASLVPLNTGLATGSASATPTQTKPNSDSPPTAQDAPALA